jgi:hypothetical protein
MLTGSLKKKLYYGKFLRLIWHRELAKINSFYSKWNLGVSSGKNNGDMNELKERHLLSAVSITLDTLYQVPSSKSCFYQGYFERNRIIAIVTGWLSEIKVKVLYLQLYLLILAYSTFTSG